MDYLKEKQSYIDRYDLFTIKECLEMIDICRTTYIKMDEDAEAKKFSKADKAKGSNWLTNQQLFIIKADRYRRKEETIQKWIDEDSREQDKYDNTPTPQNILCPDCKKLMNSSLKHLETLENPLRMMFLFNCTSCKKKRWIYEDGKERESTPQLCPKCKAEVEVSVVKENKDKLIWKTICSSCGFSETTIDDFAKSRAEREKQEEEDKKLLKEYREQFCSEEEGKEAFEYIESLKVANVVYEEELKKYDSLAYQKVSLLKKLSVSDLEKTLNGVFEKENYTKLSLDKPEMGRHIIVPFNVQDSNCSRTKDISISHLQKLIDKELEGTNWRLMSDGLLYRLGYISGRLKGYESEEDFFELSGQKKEEKPSKIDYESMMKYGGNNVVQLARLMGEFKGIENTRKKRLGKEPDGFFLDGSEGPYTCGICRENYSGDKIWWNLDGLRCADCWRNIKEGTIPPLIWDTDDSIWMKESHISFEFDVHPSSVKKLKRQGILHGRELKKEDGTVYCTVYLIAENKEFFEKYPRKPKQKMVITDLLGNKVEL